MDSRRVQYTVIKDKGIVRASIYCTCYDAIEEFNKRFMEHSTSSLMIGIDSCDSRFMMPYSFSVVAKLHPEDEWNEEEGKRIALRKLATKYNHSLDKHLHNMYNAMMKSMDKMHGYLVAHKMEV